MSAVGQLKSKDVLPARKLQRSGGCTRSEMDVRRVGGHNRAGRDERLVYHQVEVPGIRLIRTGRSDGVALDTHGNRYRTLNSGPVQWRLEEDPTRWRIGGVAAGNDKKDQEKEGEEAGHAGYGVWDLTNGAIRMGFRKACVVRWC